MKLSPRYEGPLLLRFDLPHVDVSVPLLRQRRRLGQVLDGLDEAQWTTPSRCERWTVRDVVAHLADTDQFWSYSAAASLAGEPSRALMGFDPANTPEQLVEASRSQSNGEVLDGFHAGVDALADRLGGLSADQWALRAEAPQGHIPLHAAARHALWDGWTHERDIALPLGRLQVEEPDELEICLGYVAALNLLVRPDPGSNQAGCLVIDSTDPALHLVLDLAETVVVSGREAPLDSVQLTGSAVDLIEGLSLRAPLPCPVPPAATNLLGLAAIFEE